MSPSPRPAARKKAAPRRSLILIWSAIAVALVLILVMIIVGQKPAAAPVATAEPGASQQNPAPPEIARRIAEDKTAQGAVDAPVVIVEYADYRCPYCAVFDRDTLPQIRKDYIDDGRVRFEWRDLPIFGEESIGAAIAARAAGKQDMFWEYHTAVFAAAPERGHAELPQARLIELAQQIGVPDIAAFTADLADPELRTQVLGDQQEGSALGATSTPVFLINQTPIVGAQPYSAFKQAIEAELAAVAAR